MFRQVDSFSRPYDYALLEQNRLMEETRGYISPLDFYSEDKAKQSFSMSLPLIYLASFTRFNSEYINSTIGDLINNVNIHSVAYDYQSINTYNAFSKARRGLASGKIRNKRELDDFLTIKLEDSYALAYEGYQDVKKEGLFSDIDDPREYLNILEKRFKVDKIDINDLHQRAEDFDDLSRELMGSSFDNIFDVFRVLQKYQKNLYFNPYEMIEKSIVGNQHRYASDTLEKAFCDDKEMLKSLLHYVSILGSKLGFKHIPVNPRSDNNKEILVYIDVYLSVITQKLKINFGEDDKYQIRKNYSDSDDIDKIVANIKVDCHKFKAYDIMHSVIQKIERLNSYAHINSNIDKQKIVPHNSSGSTLYKLDAYPSYMREACRNAHKASQKANYPRNREEQIKEVARIKRELENLKNATAYDFPRISDEEAQVREECFRRFFPTIEKENMVQATIGNCGSITTLNNLSGSYGYYDKNMLKHSIKEIDRETVAFRFIEDGEEVWIPVKYSELGEEKDTEDIFSSCDNHRGVALFSLAFCRFLYKNPDINLEQAKRAIEGKVFSDLSKYLIGRSAVSIEPHKLDDESFFDVMDEIQNHIEANNFLGAFSSASAINPELAISEDGNKISNRHAYSLLEFIIWMKATLHYANPHGHKDHMDLDQFRSYVREINVLDARQSKPVHEAR